MRAAAIVRFPALAAAEAAVRRLSKARAEMPRAEMPRVVEAAADSAAPAKAEPPRVAEALPDKARAASPPEAAGQVEATRARVARVRGELPRVAME